MFKLAGRKGYGHYVAVSTTNACPLTCKHCISNSGPAGDSASEDFGDKILPVLVRGAFNTERVSLTGGEPLLDVEGTAKLVHALATAGISCNIVTSAFWAKSPSSASVTLAKLGELKSLTISHDVYHAEFVRISFVKNAFVEAKRRGIKATIRLVQSYPANSAQETAYRAVMKFAAEEEVEIQRLLNYGRAATENLEGAGFSTPLATFCPSTGPHIAHDGRVTPCCSTIMGLTGDHALSLGNIHTDTPSEIQRSFEDSVLLLALKIRGRDFLMALVTEAGEQLDERMQICDLCYLVCSRPDVWARVKERLHCPEELRQLYGEAAYAFGFSEFEDKAIQALLGPDLVKE